jgi:hypothetical protein
VRYWGGRRRHWPGEASGQRRRVLEHHLPSGAVCSSTFTLLPRSADALSPDAGVGEVEQDAGWSGKSASYTPHVPPRPACSRPAPPRLPLPAVGLLAPRGCLFVPPRSPCPAQAPRAGVGLRTSRPACSRRARPAACSHPTRRRAV